MGKQIKNTVKYKYITNLHNPQCINTTILTNIHCLLKGWNAYLVLQINSRPKQQLKKQVNKIATHKQCKSKTIIYENIGQYGCVCVFIVYTYMFLCLYVHVFMFICTCFYVYMYMSYVYMYMLTRDMRSMYKLCQ